MNNCDVAIVGAGPYGLSVAAHLRAAGVNFRIFGKPMGFWLEHMPKGMHLKSEGFASSLYDPGSKFTLEIYCKERGLPYAHVGSPVPLEVFASYGMEFQKRFVPELEQQTVTLIERSSKGFQVTLSSGEVFSARRVVVAVGLTYYENLPAELAGLPGEYLSHSSKHHTLDRFKGREVAVIGAGASAIDLAALLHQAGATVHVVARVPKVRFQSAPTNLNPSRLDRLRTLPTGIGPGWKLFLCANMPLLFRQMPEKFRLDRVRRILGPAPCWFTREQVVGKVQFTLGVNIHAADVQNGRARLHLSDTNGVKSTLAADHIIAATGYKPDLLRLNFLDAETLSGIRSVENTPVLSSNFESTVPNLYFVGVTAANTFGPLLRFAFGAGFAAPRLSRHLAGTTSRDFTNRQGASRPQANREREAVLPLSRMNRTDLTSGQTNELKSERLSRTGPKVLLTDTNRWALSARLAISLAEAGCQVSVVCPTPGHPLLKTRAVQRSFPYSAMNPLESLLAAIHEVEPDIIVPACDRGVRHLHRLYERAKAGGSGGSKLADLIERSLGSPAGYSTVTSRNDFLALAREEGIRVPSISGLNTGEELKAWEQQVPLPWVLKADGTCGGGGVKIARTPEEAEEALVQLPRTFRLTRAIKRLLVNRDAFWLRSWFDRAKHPISVQSFIVGHPANCAVFAWKGRVLACTGVEVVSAAGLTGPASVVRLVDNAAMTSAAEKIAARLSMSGFFGLDFVIDQAGTPFLIEMNPRATPPCHLRLGEGRDIPGALLAELTGRPHQDAPPVTRNEMIAYYPQPDDSNPALLQGCYQDIPHSEPELIQELLRPWPNTFFFRLFVRLHQKTAPEPEMKTLQEHPHDQFQAR